MFHVEDYDALNGVRSALQKRACAASAMWPNGMLTKEVKDDLKITEKRHLTMVMHESGITLSLEAENGTVVMYGSQTIKNPNTALYDFVMKVENTTKKVYIDSLRPFDVQNLYDQKVHLPISPGKNIYVTLIVQQNGKNITKIVSPDDKEIAFTLRRDIGNTTTLENQINFLTEMRSFEEEVKETALLNDPLYQPVTTTTTTTTTVILKNNYQQSENLFKKKRVYEFITVFL